MDMKRTVFFFTLSLAAMLAHAQLTLEECQRRAQDNYPLVRQYGLIEKARGYDLSNAGKGYLPQFSLSGKATYQSDITRLPVEIPNLDIKTASKDQYQVMLEVQQTLWDGGDIRSRKRLTRAASEVELEKQHVDMYALTDRVNQLFFGILLLDEQLKQNSLLQEDLGRTHKQVADYIANGIATPSDLDAVSVEQLNTRQHRVELETTRRAYLSMLAAFTGKDLSSETVLLKPAAEENIDRQMNNRPELRWYDAQGEHLRQQDQNSRQQPALVKACADGKADDRDRPQAGGRSEPLDALASRDNDRTRADEAHTGDDACAQTGSVQIVAHIHKPEFARQRGHGRTKADQNVGTEAGAAALEFALHAHDPAAQCAQDQPECNGSKCDIP